MSDHIPFDIVKQILKNLPVKTFIQFKLVSKPWKSLIESSDFMSDYNRSQTGPSHLFMRFDEQYGVQQLVSANQIYISVVDDDTFPQHRYIHTLPESFRLLYECSFIFPRVVGSSYGLFCICDDLSDGRMIVIWNPSINKSVALACNYCSGKIGFGVRPDTLDPMLVMTNDERPRLPWRVAVSRLSTGVWTTGTMNLPRESIRFSVDQVNVNGCIYWSVDDMVSGLYLILSFDMKTEKFSEVNVPDHLASEGFMMSKLGESLGLLEYDGQGRGVWMMMEDGGEKTFTKLYTLSIEDTVFYSVPLGFRKCGNPIVGTITTVDDDERGLWLSVHDPHSKNIDGLGIYKASSSCSSFMSSYTESLLLLDHPDNHGRPVSIGIIN